jgi:hypothetical protein
MNRYLVAGMLVALLALACSPGKSTPTDLSEEDQIREVVFRYQFEFNASGLGEGATAYYLRLGQGRDPSPELLARFEGHAPPVKPLSATEIRWVGDNEVEVDGGYDEASESAAASKYRVLREQDEWRVVGSEMLWIK